MAELGKTAIDGFQLKDSQLLLHLREVIRNVEFLRPSQIHNAQLDQKKAYVRDNNFVLIGLSVEGQLFVLDVEDGVGSGTFNVGRCGASHSVSYPLRQVV